MKEAANEELDFPVMWGARGSLARSLPWQLDPGRCPDGYQTHGILTDRRLVIVGFPDDDPERDEVLWEVGRSDIAGSEKMPYSLVGGDVKITFSDDSWIRIAPHYHHEDWPIMRHLTYGLELVIRSELTSRQKKYVDKCCKREEKYNKVVDCVVTRSPKDRFLIEITPDPNPAPVEFGIIKRCKFMSKRGHQGPRTFSGF